MKTGVSGTRVASDPETAHESYSFACMRCGYGWEQEYDIVHMEYTEDHSIVVYYSDGKRVRSPFTHPTCRYCDGHVLRIMRSGRVSAAESAESAVPHR